MSKEKHTTAKRSAEDFQAAAPTPKRQRVESRQSNGVSHNEEVNIETGDHQKFGTVPNRKRKNASSRVRGSNTASSVRASAPLATYSAITETVEPEAGSRSGDLLESPSKTTKKTKKKKKKRRKGKDNETKDINEKKDVPLNGSIDTESSHADGSRSTGHNVQQNAGEEKASFSVSKNSAVKSSKLSRQNHTNQQQQQSTSKNAEMKKLWTFTIANGGQYLHRDPVFTSEGKHLILANQSAVHVYSNKNSILLRSLNAPGRATLTDYELSRSDTNHLYVASKDGQISKWDWSTGELLSCWESNRQIEFLYSVKSANADNIEMLIICSGCKGSDETEFEVLYLSYRKRSIVDRTSILRTPEKTLGLWISDDGNAIMAFSYNKLYIGSRQTNSSPSERSDSWSWRELPLTQNLVSFNVRQRNNTESRGKTAQPIDVAVGSQNGEIIIYDDILGALTGVEKKGPSHVVDLIPRKLHWHRNAAKSVKWSRDGNYLISGGQETVLVIWQLGTDRRQYLPHLSSTILNIVVSPSGSSYAAQLANNSVIILSTSTLEPTATFSGPALYCPSSSTSISARYPFPTILDTLDSRSLLAAVPVTQSTEASSFLQTFDMVSSQTFSRQALTRNSITNFNVTPAGQNVSDPSIEYLKMTSDGRWLVSVEQWVPPEEDLSVLHSTDLEYKLQRSQARDIKLRFWARDQSNYTWNLNTRIDSPHTTGSSAASILDVAVSGNRPEVATIGEDGTVRIWRPKVRRRHGQVVKNSAEELLQTWTCQCSTELEHQLPGKLTESISTASLAYSGDGSVIAVYFHEHDESNSSRLPPIYFLDSNSGIIRHQISHLITGQTARLGFLEQYLIVLSDHLRVWDTVNSRLVYGLPIQNSPNIPALKLLAIQRADRAFAVSFPLSRSKKSVFRSQIAVFKPDSSDPPFHKELSMAVTGLMAVSTSSGFIITDATAAVHFLRPPNAPALAGSVAPAAEAEKGLERLFGRATQRLAIEDQVQDDADNNTRSATDVSRRIVGLLDGPSSSSAPLSVQGLFEKVSLACTRKEIAVA